MPGSAAHRKSLKILSLYLLAVMAALALFNQHARAQTAGVWERVQVSGPESKIPLPESALHPGWLLAAGGGYMWFNDSDALENAPFLELRLGRRPV